jgi:hypothetical protein
VGGTEVAVPQEGQHGARHGAQVCYPGAVSRRGSATSRRDDAVPWHDEQEGQSATEPKPKGGRRGGHGAIGGAARRSAWHPSTVSRSGGVVSRRDGAAPRHGEQEGRRDEQEGSPAWRADTGTRTAA